MKLRYLIPLLLAVPLMAQTAAFNGYCTQGSFPVMTSGLPSSNLFQNLIPQCQVSVFLTGTTNFASIFADANNTPLANPFTASTKGQWLFFAATQQGYDVVMSGGIKPIVYTVPVTLTDLIVGAGGGGGSGCTTSGPAGTLVASNGAGGCQPAQVEVNNTPLATPNPVNFIDSPTVKGTNLDTGRIQFACSLATASSFGCAEPDNTTIVVSGGVLSATSAASNITNFEHNDTLLTGLFTPHSQIQIFDLNDTLPAAPSASLNCTWQTDPSTGRVSCFVPNAAIPQMLIVPPIGGQFVFVPFGTAVPFQSSIPTAALAFTTTAAHVTVFSNGSGFPPSTNTVTYSNAVLPSYINPANVSAVYAYLWQGGNSSVNTTCDGGLITAPLQITPSSHILSGINGTNIGTATCTFSAGGSGPRTQTFGDLPMIGLLVFYTGTPPPVQGIQIEYPLEIDLTNGALTVVNNYPTHVNPIPIASLPAPDAAPGQFYAVNDGISNADCTVGGGTTTVWCASNGFGGWAAFGGSQVYPAAGLGFSTGSAWATFTPSHCSAGNAATGIDSNGNAFGCFLPSGAISGATAGQALIAGSATTATSSKALAGSGAGITTGPTTSTNLDCAQFSGTTGQIADSGAPCGSGSGGGYTNVTGSVSQTTVAQINSAGASGTYYATTPLSIATGGTVTVPVQFSQAGLWTIASGQTVTFSQIVTETDSPHRHFAGSGTVVLAAQNAPVEWFGAVGFTAQSAAISGTDSTAFINACFSSLTSGQCTLQALWYRITAALTVANSGVGLAGLSSGGVIGNGGTGATPSAIVLTSASADILDVGSLTAFIYNNAFNDFSLFRNAFGTGTSAGMRVIKCASCLITRTYSNDSVYDYYLEGTPAYGSGGIFNNGAQWGYNSLSPSGTVHGFFIDTTVAAQSTQMNYNIAANASGILSTATGFECNGAGGGCVDIMGVGNETAQVGTGVSVTSPSDFHWTDSIDDQCNTCIFVTGGNASASADFHGGWVFANTNAVSISSSNNISIKGKTLRGAGSIVNGSGGISFVGNTILLGSGINPITWTTSTNGVINDNIIAVNNTATCITLTTGSNGNAVTGNQCSTGNTAAVGVAIAGSNNNSVFSNTLTMGGTQTGITADASSNNNHYLNMNTIVTSGTAISDANPSTNQFASASTTLDANTVNTPQFVAGGGTANAQTVTLSPVVATQSAGLHVRWIPTAGNTGATTLAVNGLATKNLTKCGTTVLASGDLATLTVAEATYDGTQYQLLNPQAVACTPSSGSGISGATSGQALIAGSATTATSSKALSGSGSGLTTGPTSSTNLDCAQFTGTSGQIADSGAPCGGGSSGAMTNITGTVTTANCTLINSSSSCQVQGSAAASITFSSIPGTYNDLQLRCTYQNSGADSLVAIVNADTSGGNYGIESMEANAAAAGTVFAATGGITFWPLAENASTTSWATSFVANFGGYANTNFFKNYNSSAQAITNNGATTQMISFVFTGVWTNTAAITSIKLQGGSGGTNIKIGSQCSLYGIL